MINFPMLFLFGFCFCYGASHSSSSSSCEDHRLLIFGYVQSIGFMLSYVRKPFRFDAEKFFLRSMPGDLFNEDGEKILGPAVPVDYAPFQSDNFLKRSEKFFKMMRRDHLIVLREYVQFLGEAEGYQKGLSSAEQRSIQEVWKKRRCQNPESARRAVNADTKSSACESSKERVQEIGKKRHKHRRSSDVDTVSSGSTKERVHEIVKERNEHRKSSHADIVSSGSTKNKVQETEKKQREHRGSSRASQSSHKLKDDHGRK